MQLPAIDLVTISDPAAHAIIRQLMHVIEILAAENAALWTEEVQRLRDECAYLHSSAGEPDIRPPVLPPLTDHFSDAVCSIFVHRRRPNAARSLAALTCA